MPTLTTEIFDDLWNHLALKTQVSYIPYDTATDANVEADTVEEIDALVTEEEKKEVQLGDGAGIYTVTKWWFLRVASMNGVNVTKRGLIVDEDERQWAVEYAFKRTAGTRWACFCVLIGTS
jgi:hypothetical protein